MSDHFSGPRALSDPTADISDVFAFPAPENPQQLVVVMDVFGKAGPTAVFSDAVIYRFRIRPVDIAGTGAEAAFAPRMRMAARPMASGCSRANARSPSFSTCG